MAEHKTFGSQWSNQGIFWFLHAESKNQKYHFVPQNPLLYPQSDITQVYALIYIHIHIHTYIHTSTIGYSACLCTYIHTYTHTYIHTHIHNRLFRMFMHLYTYIHTYIQCNLALAACHQSQLGILPLEIFSLQV